MTQLRPPLSAGAAGATGPPVRLMTFDCFDTVITRAVGGPSSVGFVTGLRLARQGLVTVGPAVYAAARDEAETLAWTRYGDAYTIEDISKEQAILLGLPCAQLLRDAELDTERRLSLRVPGSLERLAQARADGWTVGFLSDTPLPREFIGELLRQHGLLQDGDLLWVSSELQATKRRGTAYAEVVRRLGAAPVSWTHVGDDGLADVRNARWSGVQPVHRPQAALNRYEQILEGSRGSSAGLGSVLAGAARASRLQLAERRPDLPAAQVEVATGVAGPLLVGFLLWCFRQAAAAGVDRLYFVSRDGEVLLRTAQRLAAARGLDLDLRYLHGSRKAWLLPGHTGSYRDTLLSVAGREDVITVLSTLDWFDLRPERIQGPLTAAGFPAGSWNRPLSLAQLGRLADVVDHPEVVRLLDGAAERATAATGDYLSSVGLLDDTPFVLVEMMGRGTTGRLLTRVLEHLGGGPAARELYFGLNAEVLEPGRRDLQGYLYDDWRGTGVAGREADIWVALEAFTQARHGHVTGYRHLQGRAVPVLDGEVNAALVAWGLDGLRTALDTFAEHVAAALELVEAGGDVRRPTWESLRAFWLTPTDAEVALWGAFPIEYDGLQLPMGKGYDVNDVLTALRARRPALRARGTWPAAARTTWPPSVRILGLGSSLARVGLHRGRRLAQVVQARRDTRGRGGPRRTP